MGFTSVLPMAFVYCQPSQCVQTRLQTLFCDAVTGQQTSIAFLPTAFDGLFWDRVPSQFFQSVGPIGDISLVAGGAQKNISSKGNRFPHLRTHEVASTPRFGIPRAEDLCCVVLADLNSATEWLDPM